MNDGTLDPACVMNAFSYSVCDGRVFELDVPTRADWTQQRWPGWNSRVSGDAGGYGEVCRHGGQRAGGDRAEKYGAGGRR